jgi:hypothetical protein
MMQDIKTNKATTRCEEQVSVGTHQTRERVKCDAVNGHKDRSREMRLREELDPMCVMIVTHGSYTNSTPLYLFNFYTMDSVADESLWKQLEQ